MASASRHMMPSSPRKRGSSIPERSKVNRCVAEYWIVRSSRTMTAEVEASPSSPSPSLPRRDDLDLVAAFERGLGPAALRQHVEIQRDRKMRALIFELAEQRIDPR